MIGDLLTPAEPAPQRKITSAEIKIGLRASFPAPGWRLFYEVGNDTGTRVSRHADAVAIGIWPSTGHTVHGFEIKVSRADWANEMKDPAKSWSVMQFCHRWSLVTPPGLVRVDELPDNWGLITFDGRAMRTVKQAPRLTPEALTPGFVAALVRRAGEEDSAVILAAVAKAKAEWEANAIRLRRESPLTAYEARDLKRRAEEAEATVAKLKQALPDLNAYNVDGHVAAINAARRAGLGGHHDGIVRLLGTMEVMAASIRKHYAAAGFDLPEKGTVE